MVIKRKGPPRIDGACAVLLNITQIFIFKKTKRLFLVFYCHFLLVAPPPSVMSSSDADTEGYDSDRYLEADEFTEAPNFVEETRTITYSPNPIYLQRSKLMSQAIRQRVQQQSDAHKHSMPQQSDAHTQTIPEQTIQRPSYVALLVAFLITLCVLRFVLKQPCICTCNINI